MVTGNGFFDVRRTAVKTTRGRVELPMFFYDVSVRQLNFFVEHHRALPACLRHDAPFEAFGITSVIPPQPRSMPGLGAGPGRPQVPPAQHLVFPHDSFYEFTQVAACRLETVSGFLGVDSACRIDHPARFYPDALHDGQVFDDNPFSKHGPEDD